ncbi:MAG: HAD family hydrolase [Candidatus Polarisedimenticolia bacterium]
MQLSWIFLDAGNTLIGLEYAHVVKALGDAGFPTDEPSLRRAELPGRRELDMAIIARWQEGPVPRSGWVEAQIGRRYWQGMLQRAGASPERIEALTDTVLRVTRPAASWTRVAGSTMQALDAMADRGVKLAVISNSSGTLEEHLRTLGLSSRFEFIIDSHHAGVEKPHPDIFRLALERAGGLPAGEALYLGDIYAIDVLGARGAGLQAMLFDPSGQWDEALAPRGQAVCPTVMSLEQLAGMVTAPRGR